MPPSGAYFKSLKKRAALSQLAPDTSLYKQDSLSCFQVSNLSGPPVGCGWKGHFPNAGSLAVQTDQREQTLSEKPPQLAGGPRPRSAGRSYRNKTRIRMEGRFLYSPSRMAKGTECPVVRTCD